MSTQRVAARFQRFTQQNCMSLRYVPHIDVLITAGHIQSQPDEIGNQTLMRFSEPRVIWPDNTRWISNVQRSTLLLQATRVFLALHLGTPVRVFRNSQG